MRVSLKLFKVPVLNQKVVIIEQIMFFLKNENSRTFELQLCIFVSPRNVFIYQTNTAFSVTLEGDLFSYVTSVCAI